MNILVTALAICSLFGTKALAGNHWKSGPLHGVPDQQQFGDIQYPKFDILPLGEYHKGYLPGDEVKIAKHEKLVVPQPYPVKVPVPQPYPVHIPKPYPVEHVKYVKVPYPVTQVVEKKVPYPVEVPKPYPVPVEHHSVESHDQGGYESVPPISHNLGDIQHGIESNDIGQQHYGGGSYDVQMLESEYSADNQWTPMDAGEGHGQY